MKNPPVLHGLPWALAVVVLSIGLTTAAPVINEFLAVNPGPLVDDQDLSSDWIEIKNPGPGAVDLAGWALTDEPDIHRKWVFPSLTLQDGGFVVVRASGLDRRDPQQPLHANFTLSGSGEFLGLYSPADVPSTIWQPYPKQFSGVSFGTVYNGEVQGYFLSPTPGVDNQLSALTDYVRDTQFSAERGFFATPFQVEITVVTPGAEIRYTTDGSEPEANTGTRYATPIAINTTTVLRARAFKAGLLPSNTDTQTYIFAAGWKSQPALPAGFPATWGQGAAPYTFAKNSAVYRMHTAITNSTDYGALIIPAMTQTLPVLCVTGRTDEIFGDGGLHGDLRYSDVEVPVGIEYFNPLNAAERFAARGALQMHGGAIRDLAKKGFRLDFTGPFGEGPLHFPLFAGSTSENFDQLVLRPGGHDSFTASGRDSVINNLDIAFHGTYLRDQFLRRTEIAMGLLSPRGRYVHLCLNGLYWGLYELHERPNAEFCVANAGGETSAWDVLHHNNFSSTGGPQVVDGNDTAWAQLQALSSTPVNSNAVYQQLAALLGPERFIDHMLLRMWAGDYDWLGPAFDPNTIRDVSKFYTKNWYAVRNSRAPTSGPWQFFTWDGEICMGSHLLPELLNENRDDILWPVYALRKLDLDLTRISSADTPAAPWAALKAHPEFRLKVADRAQRLLFENGLLSPGVAAARLDALIQELDLPIVAESARWAAVAGNRVGRGLGNWTSSPLMTRNDHWRPETAWLRDTFVVERRDIFLSQLRAQNLYPAVEPVKIIPPGGFLEATNVPGLSAPAGTIYYTTDGTDPRVAFSGAVAPGARIYGEGDPPSGSESPFTIKARAFTAEWSALTEATFTWAGHPIPGDLAITEIHYHPAPPTANEIAAGFTDADDFEFLEITSTKVDNLAFGTLMSNLRFAAGIDFDFSLHSSRQELLPRASIVIASNAAAFQMRYGFAPAGVFANGTRLSNSGERLKLVTADGTVIAEVEYNDRGGWPAAADGGGRSLELMAPFSGTVEDDSDHWRASTEPGGNPGTIGGIDYAAWLGDYFTATEIADPLVSGELANPESDGMANLTEYATRTNPLKSSNHPVKVAGLPDGGTRFTWERRADALDIAGELQLSTDLQSWLPATGAGITVTSANTTRGTVLQSVDCTAATGIRFARLRVTVTP